MTDLTLRMTERRVNAGPAKAPGRMPWHLPLALAVLLLLPRCGEASHNPKPVIPRLPTLTPVSMGYTPGSLTLAAVFVATDRGYFRESNIDMQFVPVGNINELIGPMSTGQVDVATGGPSVGRGVRLKIVADQHTARPGTSGTALIVRKDLIDTGRVRTYADLKGRTIAIASRRAAMELDALKALRLGGLTRDDATLTYMPFPQMNLALASKAVDAAIQIEPLVAAAVTDRVAVRWKGIDEITPNRQATFIMFSEPFAAKAETARAWMVAYLRGARDFHEAIYRGGDRDKIIDILVKHAPVKDREAYRRMILPGTEPNGDVNLASLQEALAEFTTAGDVGPGANLGKIVDLSFIGYAQQVLGRYEH
jgi:NitT/TauT family transport system substrate-binding protein